MIAALILPPDLLDKLNSLASLNPQQPTVEVLVNQDDPVKASLVDDRIQALVTEANLILSQRISDQAANYLDLLVKGGTFSLPLLGDVDILGLQQASAILQGGRGAAADGQPGDRAARPGDQVRRPRAAEPRLRAAAARRDRRADHGRQAGRRRRVPPSSTRSRSRSRRRSR